MDLGLEGRRALVTGSTAGIGFATARALARKARRSSSTGAPQARVAAAVETIERRGAGCARRRHRRRPGHRRRLRARSSDSSPRSTSWSTTSASSSRSRSRRSPTRTGCASSRPTCMSGVRLSRHYVPRHARRATGAGSSSSPASRRVQIPVEMIHYGMTKTAQLAVARGLAETLAGTGVTVNSVLPGPTASEGVGELRRRAGARSAASTRRRSSASSSGPPGPPRSSSASPRPTRSPR